MQVEGSRWNLIGLDFLNMSLHCMVYNTVDRGWVGKARRFDTTNLYATTTESRGGRREIVTRAQRHVIGRMNAYNLELTVHCILYYTTPSRNITNHAANPNQARQPDQCRKGCLTNQLATRFAPTGNRHGGQQWDSLHARTPRCSSYPCYAVSTTLIEPFTIAHAYNHLAAIQQSTTSATRRSPNPTTTTQCICFQALAESIGRLHRSQLSLRACQSFHERSPSADARRRAHATAILHSTTTREPRRDTLHLHAFVHQPRVQSFGLRSTTNRLHHSAATFRDFLARIYL